MKEVVWKFPLPIEFDMTRARWKDDFTIEMPRGADVLTVQVKDRLPSLWALVNPEAEKAPRRFALVATGRPLPVDRNEMFVVWRGTFQFPDDMVGESMVFHLFEIADCPF